MGSLNPDWLSIELSTIDASTEKWTAAIRSSYEASFRSLINSEDRQIEAGLNSPLNYSDPYLRD
jgi:hypothetical protein